MPRFAIAVLLSALFLSSPSFPAAEIIPRELSDDAFSRMVADFSEEGGAFRFELMSNEREFQYVIPQLKETTKPGGVYLGVGPEQNFTYIAALQPRIAFIFDIRRQNMLEHLLYKAVFEMSSSRADFISRLFSRKAPSSGVSEKSTATDLFAAYRTTERDVQLFRQNLQAIKDRLMKIHRFPLTREDQAAIDTLYEAFFDAGGSLNNSGLRYGGFGSGATYVDLMTATDRRGQAQSYLATEENFRLVRDMERKNLIVPLVGDFAGAKAIRTVAKYLKDHDASVTAFYTSNVEQYLFQQGNDWRRFYVNVTALPIDASSTFIRSSHFSYAPGTQRQVRQLSGGNFLSLLCSMPDLVKAFAEGRIQNYEQVIQMSR